MEIKNRTIYSDKEQPHYIFTSDIHGNSNTLNLIQNACKDYPDAQLVGGGDYIDGRKDAKEVCEYLMKKSDYNSVILDGNHEELMLNFADGNDQYDLGIEPLWYVNGGKKTIRSFLGRGFSKPKASELIRQTKYYDFFKDRPIMYVTPHYIFVHGGVKPVPDFDNQEKYHENTMETNLNSYDFYRLWARKKYWYTENLADDQSEMPDKGIHFTIKDGKIYLVQLAHNKTGKTIVTGHTPTMFVEGSFDDGRTLSPAPASNCIIKVVQYPDEPARIFTDGGCHSTLPHNYGNVTVLDDKGNITTVYDYKHPNGINWSDYVDENKRKKIYGK